MLGPKSALSTRISASPIFGPEEPRGFDFSIMLGNSLEDHVDQGIRDRDEGGAVGNTA